MKITKTRILKILSFIIISFQLVSCTSVTVNQDYDTSYDFAKLKTFGFLPIPADAGFDQLNAERVGAAIRTNLIAKEYELSKEADFGIALHFGVQTQTNIDAYGYGYGWRRGGTVNVTQYDDGTLIIDFIDMEKRELIWTGSGTGTMDKSITTEERISNINYLVGEILSQFPPGTESEY